MSSNDVQIVAKKQNQVVQLHAILLVEKTDYSRKICKLIFL